MDAHINIFVRKSLFGGLLGRFILGAGWVGFTRVTRRWGQSCGGDVGTGLYSVQLER